MKIYYCPVYGGRSYVGPEEVRLGEQVLETQGLLTQLALHAGVYLEVPAFPERLSEYYKAVAQFDANSPENLFHKSFAIDGMSVAKVLLGWRDSLAMAGWDGRGVDGCQRITALAGIEEYYEDDSMAMLLRKLMDALEKESGAFRGMEIVLPCSVELMPDYLKGLFERLGQLGVVLSVESGDGVVAEVEEVHFSQRWKAEAWLSGIGAEEYDVWINTDNKRFDNWLHMSGQPTTGSRMVGSNPQISQLFLLVVQLFQRPLDVNVLVQYLLSPVCPLYMGLARRLADAVISTGGFCNEKVCGVVDWFLGECDWKSLEQREANYRNFLPFDLRRGIPADFARKDVLSFLEKVRDYVSGYAGALDSDDAKVPQLFMLSNLLGTLLRQIGETQGELTFEMLQQWAQSLYEPGSFIQYSPQVGSRYVIESPSNIVVPSEKTIWCDFFGDVPNVLSTDFLSPLEKRKLTESGVKLWSPEHEAEFYRRMMSRPLYMTRKKLTLVTCEKQGMTVLPIHPLSLQIPESHRVVDGDSLYGRMLVESVIHVDNSRGEDLVSIGFDAEKHCVKFRDKESYSSLEEVLQNPSDYMFRYILGFWEAKNAEISIYTTIGNVVHDVIENMFLGRVSDYDTALAEAIDRVGALLLLPEYHFSRELLSYQLEICIDKLRKIIKENGLKVVECERSVSEKLGFPKNIDITGFIDMVLEDQKGDVVIFDLKWTSTKDKHRTLLEKNRATQLAIYKAVTGKAVRTAYFVMPQGKLYTTDDFRGDDVVIVESDSKVDVMEQLRQGYAKRLEEIGSGFLETSGGMSLSEIDYAQTPGVFPLDSKGSRDPKKVENIYSDYGCFFK